jgi:hypothetical protein
MDKAGVYSLVFNSGEQVSKSAGHTPDRHVLLALNAARRELVLHCAAAEFVDASIPSLNPDSNYISVRCVTRIDVISKHTRTYGHLPLYTVGTKSGHLTTI